MAYKNTRKNHTFSKNDFWIYFFYWADPTQEEVGPKSTQKIKSGQDRPKREPTCGWTQPSRVGWADVPAPKKPTAGCCAEHNNNYFPLCCRTWIAHVLHANGEHSRGARKKGGDYLEWGSVVVVSGGGGGGSRLRTVVLPLLLRASFSRRCASFLFSSSSTSASPCFSVLLLLSAGGGGRDWDCERWLGNQVAAVVMVVLRRFFFSVLCSSLYLFMFSCCSRFCCSFFGLWRWWSWCRWRCCWGQSRMTVAQLPTVEGEKPERDELLFFSPVLLFFCSFLLFSRQFKSSPLRLSLKQSLASFSLFGSLLQVRFPQILPLWFPFSLFLPSHIRPLFLLQNFPPLNFSFSLYL